LACAEAHAALAAANPSSATRISLCISHLEFRRKSSHV
jgi:hypothetical protein